MNPSTQQPSRRRTRRSAVVALATAAFGVLAPSAGAEVKQTAQAVAAHATWLAYAPAPSRPAAVCIVDSGVDLNADTNAAVVRRVALDGGTPDDVDPAHHGTLMAMMAAAAVNDTGMVGAAPTAVRIISIRSATPSVDQRPPTSPFNTYAAAIRSCTKNVGQNLQVIELALANDEIPTDAERAELEDQVVYAHSVAVNVVAAAGNNGGPVKAPASTPGILGIGGSDDRGAFCSFSSRGEGIDLLAPGCGLNTADPATLQPADTQGTSQASAFTAGALAALRAYAPDLSWSEAERLLSESSPGGVLDVEAAFRAAGLGSVVDAGIAATPNDPGAAQPTGPASSAGGATTAGQLTPVGVIAQTKPGARWATPRVRSLRYRRGVVSITVGAGRPSAVLVVKLQHRVRGRWRSYKSARTGATRLRIRSSHRPGRVGLAFFDPSGMNRDSAVRYVSSLR